MNGLSTKNRRTHAAEIARALATEGGHLLVGRGGATLHFDNCRLSGCVEDEIKAECIEAGLPVIDSRTAPFEAVCRLAVGGPMIAVNEPPCPEPWNSLSYAPLAVVAERYRRAGAEVFNVPAAPSSPEKE